MAEVELRKAYKRYGDVEVIHGVDMTLSSGEFIVFVGPSGCGKSTLLRMVAGLEDISEGSVHIGGRDVTHVEAVDRGIAMVFQSYALYPHMTVEENMGFGLRMGGGISCWRENRKIYRVVSVNGSRLVEPLSVILTYFYLTSPCRTLTRSFVSRCVYKLLDCTINLTRQ